MFDIILIASIIVGGLIEATEKLPDSTRFALWIKNYKHYIAIPIIMIGIGFKIYDILYPQKQEPIIIHDKHDSTIIVHDTTKQTAKNKRAISPKVYVVPGYPPKGIVVRTDDTSIVLYFSIKVLNDVVIDSFRVILRPGKKYKGKYFPEFDRATTVNTYITKNDGYWINFNANHIAKSDSIFFRVFVECYFDNRHKLFTYDFMQNNDEIGDVPILLKADFKKYFGKPITKIKYF